MCSFFVLSCILDLLFQFFLIFTLTFFIKGIISVEIKVGEHLPIASVLSQGYSASDGWLLLRRLNPLTAPQTIENNFPNIIELSP